MKNTAGRISVKNRKALVAPIAEFAKTNNIPVNLVMSAVLWAGERIENRMSLSALKELINAETVLAYRAELNRRSRYHQAQVEGIVRNALPKEHRLPATIEGIASKVPAGKSLPAVKAWVEKEIKVSMSSLQAQPA